MAARAKGLHEEFPNLVDGSGEPGNPDYVPPVLQDFRWAIGHPSTDSSLNERTVIEKAHCPGFDPRRAALEGRLGAAVYFADCPPKSFSYTKCTAQKCKSLGKGNVFNHHCEEEEHLADVNRPRAILLARALLGKPKVVYDSMRKIRLAPDGFDSIIAPSKHCLRSVPAAKRPNSTFWFSEYTVYEKNNCYPEYLIEWLPSCTPLIDQDLNLRLPAPVLEASLLKTSVSTSNPNRYRFSQLNAVAVEDQVPKSGLKSSAVRPSLQFIDLKDSSLGGAPSGTFPEVAALCKKLTQNPVILKLGDAAVAALTQLASSKESLQYLTTLLAIQDQPELAVFLQKRWELNGQPELIPVKKRPGVFTNTGIGGPPVEDVLRACRWERIDWWILPAAVHFLDLSKDSFVDYREFELFSCVFGPNYSATLNGVAGKQWFRYLDADDSWLLGKTDGTFVLRLNSRFRTMLTVAIVKTPKCTNLTDDLMKAKIDTDPTAPLYQITGRVQAVGLVDLLEKLQGIDFKGGMANDAPRPAYFVELLQNFSSRVKVIGLLQSKLDPSILDQYPEAGLFFSALRKLKEFLNSSLSAPLPVGDLSNFFKDLLEFILFPYLLQHELKKVLILDHQGRAFGETLFGAQVPLHDRLGSHPLFRFLELNPETKGAFKAVKQLRRILVSSSSIGGSTSSAETLTTLTKVRETALDLANLDTGKFQKVTQSAYLQDKVEELALALADFEQNLADSSLRREVDVSCYDLAEGFDALECIEQGILQLPELWTQAFGPSVLEATQENLQKMLGNYFGPALGSLWQDILPIIQRKSSNRARVASNNLHSERKVPVTVFMALLAWIGGLPRGLPPPKRAEKLKLLRELVSGDWFLGFVSRAFSGVNLEQAPLGKAILFYGRVSVQNPNTITIDFYDQKSASLKRTRVIPPGGLDPEEKLWTLDKELGPMWCEGAPSVVELVQKLRAKNGWLPGPELVPVSAEEEWNHDSAGHEYVNQQPSTSGGPLRVSANSFSQLLETADLLALLPKFEKANIVDALTLCQAVPTDAVLEKFGAKVLGDRWSPSLKPKLAALLEAARSALGAFETCTNCNPPKNFRSVRELAEHNQQAHPGVSADYL